MTKYVVDIVNNVCEFKQLGSSASISFELPRMKMRDQALRHFKRIKWLMEKATAAGATHLTIYMDKNVGKGMLSELDKNTTMKERHKEIYLELVELSKKFEEFIYLRKPSLYDNRPIYKHTPKFKLKKTIKIKSGKEVIIYSDATKKLNKEGIGGVILRDGKVVLERHLEVQKGANMQALEAYSLWRLVDAAKRNKWNYVNFKIDCMSTLNELKKPRQSNHQNEFQMYCDWIKEAQEQFPMWKMTYVESKKNIAHKYVVESISRQGEERAIKARDGNVTSKGITHCCCS
ncbi:hypothetical protein ASG89_34880 [Paenibacillus sp. Soil766]|uniref:reverse transcriptase-like protein n=1 Tax=Paenibacillus sp. Soil766 TaxID=1736404 RepID=UPI00070D73A9|nr:reverse transcriptase-like protein [Paenibacillus sp. Soil766]KRE88286.1 hypothetical protein ASG89_34880 [Paenibacillus sp. Soil766]